MVTFNNPTIKEWYNQNNQQIQQAFREQVKEAYKTFTVLIKGLKRADLQNTIEEAFGTNIGLKTVNKVKFQLLHNQEFTRATILVIIKS